MEERFFCLSRSAWRKLLFLMPSTVLFSSSPVGTEAAMALYFESYPQSWGGQQETVLITSEYGLTFTAKR